MASKHFIYLREFVYGGMDGCVTTFAVVAGATGAHLSAGIIITLGFANLIADGFSMSVGNFLSVKSEFARNTEIKTEPVERSPLRTSVATFVSFILVGLVPLFAYVLSYLNVLGSTNPFTISSVLTALSFIIIGLLRSHVTRTSIFVGVAETLLLGTIAALLAYFVGNLLEKLI